MKKLLDHLHKIAKICSVFQIHPFVLIAIHQMTWNSLYSVVVVILVSFFLAFLIYFIKLSDGHYPFCAACSYQF